MSLISNPFGSSIGRLIESVTDPKHYEPNWSVIIEISDQIRRSESRPEDSESLIGDAVRAIRKRLSQQTSKKDNHGTELTLTLLEALLKNGGRRFQIAISQREFLQDLSWLLDSRAEASSVVRERILIIIQSLSDEFSRDPAFVEVVRLHRELVGRGVEFPGINLDSMPGPLASQPRESPTANRRTPLASSASAAPTRSARAEATGSGTGSGSGTGTPGSSSASRVEEQLAKIRLDLSVVRANVRVLNEMLRELTPAHEPPEELDLLFVRCDAASAAA